MQSFVVWPEVLEFIDFLYHMKQLQSTQFTSLSKAELKNSCSSFFWKTYLIKNIVFLK